MNKKNVFLFLCISVLSALLVFGCAKEPVTGHGAEDGMGDYGGAAPMDDDGMDAPPMDDGGMDAPPMDDDGMGAAPGDADTGTYGGDTADIPPPTEVCGIVGDEDGDGLINCADPDCADYPTCVTRGAPIGDTRTTDGGGLIGGEGTAPDHISDSGTPIIEGDNYKIVGELGYFGLGDGNGLHSSQRPTGLDLHSVDFVSSQTGWVVGPTGTILKTVNGGETWVPQHSPANDRVLNSVSFVDAQTGWIVGSMGTILYTSDGGSHWVDQTQQGNPTLLSVYAVDEHKAVAVGEYGASILYDGNEWVDVDSGTTRNLRSVVFENENVGWIVGDWGIIRKTNDGGSTWIPQFAVGRESESIRLNAVDLANDQVGWAVGNAGVVLRTTDGGENWASQDSGTPFAFNGLVAVSDVEAYAVGDNGVFFRTVNGGRTWEEAGREWGVRLLGIS